MAIVEIENLIFELMQTKIYVFIFVVLLIERIKRKGNKSLFSAWIINVSGVILHELSHFVVALLLNGKPNSFSIIPKKETIKGKTYFNLGKVGVSNLKWYNRFFIGMSPLFLLFALYFIDIYFFTFFEDNLYTNFLYIFLIIIILDSSIPSVVDFKEAFSGLGYVFSILIIMFIFYMLDLYKIIELDSLIRFY